MAIAILGLVVPLPVPATNCMFIPVPAILKTMVFPLVALIIIALEMSCGETLAEVVHPFWLPATSVPFCDIIMLKLALEPPVLWYTAS